MGAGSIPRRFTMATSPAARTARAARGGRWTSTDASARYEQTRPSCGRSCSRISCSRGKEVFSARPLVIPIQGEARRAGFQYRKNPGDGGCHHRGFGRSRDSVQSDQPVGAPFKEFDDLGVEFFILSSERAVGSYDVWDAVFFDDAEMTEFGATMCVLYTDPVVLNPAQPYDTESGIRERGRLSIPDMFDLDNVLELLDE